ncbi:DUF3046 domain-containing protein [Microbacterium sp. C7(2022)]|uniref:DUF3046 domain-containing protein n=1 Tax=Microbacterium sp. C7(2022) TaxID=2992759 RepID=UPI00237ACE99|nr:DUF3046 domain-containing protein [Microbacterium sp. C7(2022)]MDE0545897.1 DUF3046 domain-containing protein [Microbacterium sp. C7(2022)]
MRRSEFDRAVSDEFGARASTVTGDLVLSAFGDRSARDALSAGADPRDVWLALCAEMDVPAERRYGVGRRDPKKP